MQRTTLALGWTSRSCGSEPEGRKLGGIQKIFRTMCRGKETSGRLPEPTLKIAATIKESELQGSLIDDLDKLAPFGQENPEPILALRNVSLAYEPKKVGSGNHFQFSVFNGTRNISGIAWNMSENMPSSTTQLDLAFKLRWNHWNGRKNPQMVLEDWKVSG